MMKVITILMAVLFLASCYQTETGLVIGVPDYEKRNVEVTQVDLDILLSTDTLLKEKSSWSKEVIRVCKDPARLTLLCAMERASIEVNGQYIHRQPALQEVRFIIDDNYPNRWKVHRLEEFNSHPETTFEDVKSVVAKAIANVQDKMRMAHGKR